MAGVLYERYIVHYLCQIHMQDRFFRNLIITLQLFK